MIVDASALIAVLAAEADSRRYLQALVAARAPRVPAPTWVEATVVASRFGPAGVLQLRQLVERTGVEVLAFTEAHAARAVEAFAVYGKGSGHAAGLNLGDCLVYGAASVERLPLLFKGDDFVHTDLVPALPG